MMASDETLEMRNGDNSNSNQLNLDPIEAEPIQAIVEVEAADSNLNKEIIDLNEDIFSPEDNELELNTELGYDSDSEQRLVIDEIPFSTPDGKSHHLASYSDEVAPPEEGMVFQSWELVESYFRSYAKQQGFGIVRGASAFRQKNGRSTKDRRSITLHCEMSGKKDLRVRVNGRKTRLHSIGKQGAKFATRKSKKCDCPINIYASAKKDDEWVIRRVNLEHEGHSPRPSMARHVAMFRHDAINAVVRKKLIIDSQAGIKLPLIHRSLAIERNGLENCPFTQRDLRNVLAKDMRLRLQMEGGDANAMVNYFKRMASNQEQFFHAERVDEFEQLKDIMWVDARSRVAYQDFGDVVCFDSTYITNKYHLPFAIFVGLNHHGQTLLLGCALLRHENTETFEWLFTNWVSCMGGNPPKGFLTDQCAAMRKAAANVMPQSRHRWCIWHIMQKFKDKLGSYKKYEDIKTELTEAIYDSLTVEEFQQNWQAVIKKFKLQNNEWLAGLYKEQEMWVPAHMRHIFWAGMKTTQRSESINSFFDGYVQKHTSLSEFATQYFLAMEARANAEEAADADCERNEQELVTGFPIEEEFQKIYTHAKFFEFKTECLKLVFVSLLEKRAVGDFLVEYVVGDRIWRRCKVSRKDIATDRSREYIVTLDLRTNNSWCVCKMFESHGIMCRHLIRVFDINKVKKVPEMFILRRWRKDIEREHTKIQVKHHDLSKSEEVKRFDNILSEAEILCMVGSKNEECMDMAIECIREAVAKIKRKANEAAAALSHEADNINKPNSTPSSVNNKRPVDNSKVSPPSTKKPCPSSGCENLPPTPGMKGSTGIIGTPPDLPDIVKDPPLPKKPRHRTTDSRYKSASELATKGKGTTKGRKKKNKEDNTDGIDPSLNATLQESVKAIQLLLQHQTNTLYQQQSQPTHQGIQQQHQAPYAWGTYQQQGCSNAVPRYTQQQSLPPPYATAGTNGPHIQYTLPDNGVNNNAFISPPPSQYTSSTQTHPNASSSHYTNAFPCPRPTGNGFVPTTVSTFSQPSFGGIGLSERSASGQVARSLGYMTSNLGHPNEDWVESDGLNFT